MSDEPDHNELRRQLLEGVEPVVTSELAYVELTAAIAAAGRAGRLRRPTLFLHRFEADCSDEGPIALLRLEPERVLDRARGLLVEHPLRTLDAIHLAVALLTAMELAAGEPLVFVTRDADQASAATALGLRTE